MVRTEPSSISARTSAVATPAAAAISRAVNTSGTVALMEDMVDLLEGAKRLPCLRATGNVPLRCFRPLIAGPVMRPAAGLCSCRDSPSWEGTQSHEQFPVSSLQLPERPTSIQFPVARTPNSHWKLETGNWKL